MGCDMTADAKAELRLELGELAAIERLTQDQATALKAAVSGARERQGRDLAAARDEALGHIPALLRGSVRRALGV